MVETYGWDASNYDNPPGARDGIDFYTHKLSDGDHYYADPKYTAAMEAARALGVPILGAYHVLHGGRSISAQGAWMIQLADQRTPWWRTHPYWVWQLDAEPFAYLTRPTIEECNAFCAYMVANTGVPVRSMLGYLPAWSYGTQVQQLAYPWWASSYVTGSGPYQALYPGNSSGRWVGGGRHADILQYTSSAVIAGQTTSDANAFAGSLDQLKAFLRPDIPTPPLTEDDDMKLWYVRSGANVQRYTGGTRTPVTDLANDAYWALGIAGATGGPTVHPEDPTGHDGPLRQDVQGPINYRVAPYVTVYDITGNEHLFGVLVTEATSSGAGQPASVDTAAVISAVNALQDDVVQLRAQLAAGVQAEAAALAVPPSPAPAAG